MHGVVFNASHTNFMVGDINFKCREGFGWTLFHYVIGQTVGRIFKELSSEAVNVESTIGRRRVYMKKADAASFREVWAAAMPATNTGIGTNPTVQEPMEQVIEQIKVARARGEKVSLFVGRGAEQSVPYDGSFWVTLDIQPRSKTTTPTHPHLCMDFNDDESGSLDGLFDRVVVDSGVAHCLHSAHNFYKQFLPLLFPDERTELIVEHLPAVVTMSGYEPLYDVQRAFVRLPEPGVEKFSSLFRELEEETERYLKGFFRYVRLEQMPKHPCRGDGEAPSGGPYWVLRSPKRRGGNVPSHPD